MSLILRSKLSIMMFLQFMLVASFWVQLSSYLDKMHVEGIMFALIMSTMAIGSAAFLYTPSRLSTVTPGQLPT